MLPSPPPWWRTACCRCQATHKRHKHAAWPRALNCWKASERLRVLATVWVDLGGIAKGYAVDCAAAALQSQGMGSGLVNAGGDMCAFGPHSHPVHLRFADGFRAVAELRDGALASSCNAACGTAAASPHIEPRSGRAVLSRRSVVVQARSAAVADALTKVAMLRPATADRMCAALRAQWRAFEH